MLKPKYTPQFKKDYKVAIKRGCDKEKLRTVIELLCLQTSLLSKYMYHALINSRN
ncbi:type II toxin-antitoxin system YafQ family toxin [Holdemanella biformis]|uniref:type II toxin-antitoxin system YafQ family toxin n=1 Tax=Holdemanella biformis TaxID=1735 RepID=UPI00325AB676